MRNDGHGKENICQRFVLEGPWCGRGRGKKRKRRGTPRLLELVRPPFHYYEVPPGVRSCVLLGRQVCVPDFRFSFLATRVEPCLIFVTNYDY